MMRLQTIVALISAALLATACASVERIETEKGQFDLYRLAKENVVVLPEQDIHFLISGSDRGVVASATDPKGNIVLAATVTPNGMPGFMTSDAEMKMGTFMGLNSGGQPTFYLIDKEKFHTVLAGMNSLGFPLLSLNVGGTDKGPHARISFTERGGRASPFILLESERHKYAIASGFGESGEPTTVMRDSKGRPRLKFGIGPDDAPYIELLDENGKTVWSAK